MQEYTIQINCASKKLGYAILLDEVKLSEGDQLPVNVKISDVLLI